MIKFIIRGVLKDKNRSLFPVLIVASGVMLTVFLSCWINGIMGDSVDLMAKFTSGHVKVMTKAYAEDENQMPNDLAILGSSKLISELKTDYPQMDWVERIKFGGLLDVPDENGDTKNQGPTMGMAVDILSKDSKEIERLNIKESLKQGRFPEKQGEILLSDDFAKKLELEMGDDVTLFGSTMHGSMTFHNFTVVGTVRFGASGLDRGSVIVDISDAKLVLDMEDASSEILGYLHSEIYDDEEAVLIEESFNKKYLTSSDEFAPVMVSLRNHGSMAEMFVLIENMSAILISFFIFALSIVLWNTGLLNGLRRYNEFGIRLAMGENKGHIYRSLLTESFIVGVIGSTLGTGLGLTISYILQENGLDFSQFTQGASSALMMPNVYRAVVSPEAFYIGFIPGVLSIFLGNALSGIGIYKRKTAQLFKELEV